MIQQYRSVCPYDCPDRCGLLATVENGRITKVQGDPEHPVTKGFLCRKMQHYEQDIHSPERILTPYRRVGEKGKKESFVPVSWDEAVSEICSRWKEIADRYGADTIVPYSYAGTMGVLQRNCGEAFFSRLGGAVLERTVCSIGHGEAVKLVSGSHASLPAAAVLEADFLLLYSHNPKVTHLHMTPLLQKARENGTKLVLVDVYAHASADLCDEVILIRPGTDSALLLAMMHVLEKEDLLDTAYIRAHTTGFARLQEEYRKWTPEKAGEICGIRPDIIRDLARAYGRAARPVITVGYGFSRCTNGGAASALLECLPVLTGAWNRGGGTAGTAGLASCSDKTAVTRPDLAPDGPRQVINMNQIGTWLTHPAVPVRSLYVYHSNPAVMAPSQNLVRKGLDREDLFLVVHDRFFTDTAVRADIVLPAVFSVEQDDILESYGHYHMQYGKRILDPPGACRSNWDTFRALAAGMGFEDAYFDRTETEVLRDLMVKEGLWDDLLTEEQKVQLQEGRPVAITPPDVQEIPTEDHRFHLWPRDMCYRPHTEQRYSLRMVMSHSPWAINSNFSYREELMQDRGGPTLRMHPEDAAQRHLSDGDMAWAYNDFGRIRVKIRETKGILPGTVNADGVHQDAWCYGGGNFSALTAPEVSDSAGGPLHNDSSVEVSRD